ncbi:MAG: cadherin-like domain-containing protein [Candidatus Scalindua sp.]|nr:cadherin-like domain-containing protein [Candidatus Scalindua sp.]
MDTLVNINVTANDTDSDGTIYPATVAVISAPANGTAVPKVNGTVDYTAAMGYTGQDTFTYTVNDNLGATSNAATVTVTVNPGGTPAITSPAPGFTLTSSTVTFQWNFVSGVSRYWLGVGTSFASVSTPPWGDIYSASSGINTMQQVTGIPINGNPVYVRLWCKIGTEASTYRDYTYQTQITGNQTPVITSPIPGSTLTTSTVNFQWSAGTGVSVYWLGVGTSFSSVNTPPYGDIYGASTLKRITQQVTGIPMNGSLVYVRLWWKIGTGAWTYGDYTYQTQ